MSGVVYVCNASPPEVLTSCRTCGIPARHRFEVLVEAGGKVPICPDHGVPLVRRRERP